MTETIRTKNNPVHNSRTVNILGIRGIPASHGGFETFAERLALHLVSRGWKVNVYCQSDESKRSNNDPPKIDDWNGIARITISGRVTGSLGSVIFDWRAIHHNQKSQGIDLILGYNTAIFLLRQRIHGRTQLINMDGIEWKRAKWTILHKIWLYANEFVAAHIAFAPIADHPKIAEHLKRHGCRRAVVIPYGADTISSAPISALTELKIKSREYLIAVARIEPENSILEIVRAYSKSTQAVPLVLLGGLDNKNKYHRAVKAAASPSVIFPGPIYDRSTLAALRFHALAYIHGHQVGGTNPSLVEALGAANPIIAHDNPFNRWVAGPNQLYFKDETQLTQHIDTAISSQAWRSLAASQSRLRHCQEFTWERVLAAYEALLTRADVNRQLQRGVADAK
jgi:glycosyltransferase involved in cell wall biosynthesis